MFTDTKFKRDARSVTCAKGKFVCRGNGLLTRRRHFSFGRRLVCDRVSMRHLHSRQEVGAAFDTSMMRVGGERFVRVSARFFTSGSLRLSHTVGPAPFVPGRGSLGRQYRRVFTVRATKLTGEVVRARSGATIVNVSNNLSSALTLLMYAGAFSGLKLSQGSVVKMAVPKFKAASHACSGTVGLVRDLNVGVHRVDVGGTYVRRFRSLNRSVGGRGMICRGTRTERHARVLVSITGRIGKLIVNANSLSRLTLN